jgi:hypothetical protein
MMGHRQQSEKKEHELVTLPRFRLCPTNHHLQVPFPTSIMVRPFLLHCSLHVTDGPFFGSEFRSEPANSRRSEEEVVSSAGTSRLPITRMLSTSGTLGAPIPSLPHHSIQELTRSSRSYRFVQAGQGLRRRRRRGLLGRGHLRRYLRVRLWL